MQTELELETTEEPVNIPTIVIPPEDLLKKRNFSEAAKVVYSFCPWSINEWKLFILVVSHLNSIAFDDKNINSEAPIHVYLPLKTMWEKMGFLRQNGKRNVIAAAVGLQSKLLRWVQKTEDDNIVVVKNSYISFIVANEIIEERLKVDGEERAYIKMSLNGIFRKLFLGLRENFFTEDADLLIKFKSVYALKLYMVLMYSCKISKTNSVCRDYKPESLRTLMSVDEKAYPRPRDFSKFILYPAVKEIEKLTNMSITITEKRGRHKHVEVFNVSASVAKPVVACKGENVGKRNVARILADIETAKTDDVLMETCLANGMARRELLTAVKNNGYERVKDAVDNASVFSRSDFKKALYASLSK